MMLSTYVVWFTGLSHFINDVRSCNRQSLAYATSLVMMMVMIMSTTTMTIKK